VATFDKAMIGVGDAIYKAVLGPAGLNLTPNQLTINVFQWVPPAGEPPRVGNGTKTTLSTLTLAQCFPMRTMSAREVASSGGRFIEGTIVVEDISPPGSDPATGSPIGYGVAQLRPQTALDSQNGIEVVYTVTGQLAGDYALADADFSDWQYFILKLNPRRTTR
jgi:hypothetical protein